MELKNKKILFICSSYFGYYALIKKALERNGCIVDYISDSSTSKFGVLSSLMGIRSPELMQERFWYGNLRILKKSYDCVFVVKGNTIPLFVYEELKNRYRETPFIQYHWDDIEIASNKGIKKTFKFFDRILCYNIHDANKFGFILRPMFYTRLPEVLPKKIIDILMVASYNSIREVFLNNFAQAGEFKTKIHYYINPFIYAKEKVTGGDVGNRSRYVFHKLKYDDMNKFLSMSKSSIDIPNEKQLGLTTRSIEGMAYRTKIITTNRNAVLYDYYRPENFYFIDVANPVIDKGWIDEPYKEIDEDVLIKYNIDSWLKEIFDI